jgi:hypothetical protein
MLNRITILSTIILSFWMTFSSATNPFDQEFDHFLKTGIPSGQFISNMSSISDAKVTAKLEDLEKEDRILPRASGLSTNNKTIVLCQEWVTLAQLNDSHPFWALLCLNKCLSIHWIESVALEIADRCHQLLSTSHLNQVSKMQTAHRGLEALRVELKEQDFNLHRRLASASQVVILLEDLLRLTAGTKTPDELPFPLSHSTFLNENCIPSAAISQLLVVAYGGRIIANEGTLEENQAAQCRYGRKCIFEYMSGLDDEPSPAAEFYYVSQICITALDLFSRVPKLMKKEKSIMTEILNTHVLKRAELIRIKLNEIDPSQKPTLWCHTTYDLGRTFQAASQIERSLPYFQQVVDLDVLPESPGAPMIENLKVKCQYYILIATDQNAAPEYKLKHLLELSNDC